MRLINTRTLQLEEFFDASIPKYAILSHTWEKEEILFSDMTDLDTARRKAGFAKLQGACILAASQRCDYIWIDTCCIDKSSNAELSEAINSMYRWYKESQTCYAYLSDVTDVEHLGNSRWFSRGWTLQELIAPVKVEFYGSGWEYLGKKDDPSFRSILSQASLVDECVLTGSVHPTSVSVAKRMYWASKGRTTRREDEAYCLMGLFDVNMPLLYGEGDKAFMRLQQEIVRITDDQSILAWYCHWDADPDAEDLIKSCLAPSPRCFAKSGGISLFPPERSRDTFRPSIDFNGRHVELSAVTTSTKENKSPPTGGKWLGSRIEVILNCQIGPVPWTFATLRLIQWNDLSCSRELDHGIVTQRTLYCPGFLFDHGCAELVALDPTWYWNQCHHDNRGLKILQKGTVSFHTSGKRHPSLDYQR
jgi:hypothetical protein